MNQSSIKTAVIGHPIAHSKSPKIHNYWIEKYGLYGTYTAIDIPPKNLKQAIQSLIDQGYKGFNVTVPHKIEIMALCDEIDDLAQKIGAVNTVNIQDGKLHGSNTDAYGFIQNIKENTKNWRFKDGGAVVLGAGGAANAVIYALLKEGVPSITITNRTREKAEALVKLSSDKINVIDWDDRNAAFSDANLIVNTTALGMVNKPPLDVDISDTPASALVTDIVYAPLMTDLLCQAKDNNLQIVTGIGMLLHQARPGFKLWNGVLPDVTDDLVKLILK